MKTGRRLATGLVVSVTLLATTCPPAAVVAGEGDGVVQPGDRTAPGRCSAGPAFDGVIFTAAHCTVDSIDGRKLRQLGANPDDGIDDSTGLDVQWFDTDSELSNTIATADGDVAVAGVLRPWPGLRVQKSGWVSGVTAGVVTDHPDYLVSGSSVKGLQVCHGDSGAVAYARVGPADDVYLVGMVTNGNGGTNRVTGEEEPNGTCSEFPPIDGAGEPDYWAVIRRVDALCEVAGLSQCVEDAGRVFAAIESSVGTDDGALIDVWAFDASDVGVPVTLSISVDGGPPGNETVSQPSIRRTMDYSLPSGAAVATSIAIEADPGPHEVCVTARNQGPGIDVDLGCRTVRAGPRYAGLVGGPAIDGEGDFERWLNAPAVDAE